CENRLGARIASSAAGVNRVENFSRSALSDLIATEARLHPRDLLGRRFGLKARLPLVHRHSVDHFASGGLVSFETTVADPVGQAIAAEPCQPHQIYVLRIVAVAQVAHEAAEGGGGHRVGQLVDRVAGFVHSRLPSLDLVLSPGSAIGRDAWQSSNRAAARSRSSLRSARRAAIPTSSAACFARVPTLSV